MLCFSTVARPFEKSLLRVIKAGTCGTRDQTCTKIFISRAN